MHSQQKNNSRAGLALTHADARGCPPARAQHSMFIHPSTHPPSHRSIHRSIVVLLQCMKKREVSRRRFFDACPRSLFSRLLCLLLAFASPGRYYAHKVYISASRLQLWWLIWAPRRQIIKYAAASLIQQHTRGYLARIAWWRTRHIMDRFNINMHKRRDRLFRSWRNYAHLCAVGRKMLNRASHQYLWRWWKRLLKFHHICQQEKLRRIEVAARQHSRAPHVHTNTLQ